MTGSTPTTRQERKAAFGLRQLDDFQTHIVCCGRLCRLVPDLALIHKGDLDMLSRLCLHRLSQRTNLLTILLIGGRDHRF